MTAVTLLKLISIYILISHCVIEAENTDLKDHPEYVKGIQDFAKPVTIDAALHERSKNRYTSKAKKYSKKKSKTNNNQNNVVFSGYGKRSLDSKRPIGFAMIFAFNDINDIPAGAAFSLHKTPLHLSPVIGTDNSKSQKIPSGIQNIKYDSRTKEEANFLFTRPKNFASKNNVKENVDDENEFTNELGLDWDEH